MNSELFPNSELYDTGYCVLFAKGVGPELLLSRVADGGPANTVGLDRHESELIKALGEDIDSDDFADLSMAELEAAGMFDDSGPLLRSGRYEEWSFVVESEGPYLAGEAVLQSASKGTSAFSAMRSESGSTWISYAENGEILSSFDPLFPDVDSGSRPAVLDQLAGHREAIARGERADAYENALRQIQQRLGCAAPASVDAERLTAIRLSGQY
ncbi:DUF6461 domain-containing protein [Streptomyces parvulus]|uniref:DUF6461 domain-containing protein n=1 Tax=Streptomyces parvulus TaxID=146923 RepID=UPI0033BD1B57